VPTIALTGLRHEWQTWNNCGPATLSYNLSYFGSPLRQEAVRQATRPNKEDKNVNPEELAAFAQSQGFQALVRVDGSAELLRTLVANGMPVMVETWLEPKPNDGMGHYRLLTGYDDATREWIVYDSYVSHGISKSDPYQGIRIPYDELASLWRVFNRTYLIIYTAEQSPQVEALLGPTLDDATMWQQALVRAQAEIAANPRDAFAWFNLGSTLTAMQRYDEAAAAFDQARQIGLPWRMLWYQFGPFRAYSEVGRHAEVLALAEATLATTQDIEELHYWRGRALQAMGQLDAARAAYDRAVSLNPFFSAAADARRAL
jgi:tetratricopeptide (TPR) repeat protein